MSCYECLIEAFGCAQIPDAKSGNDTIDIVVVDEEAVGSVDTPGYGAKVLRRDGLLEPCLHQTTSAGPMVCFLAPYLGLTPQSIPVMLTLLVD